MDVYLRYEYKPDLRGNKSPDDFIGPFPPTTEEFVKKFRNLFGPVLATIVTLDTPPDPIHTVSPGTFVDDLLKRV